MAYAYDTTVGNIELDKMSCVCVCLSLSLALSLPPAAVMFNLPDASIVKKVIHCLPRVGVGTNFGLPQTRYHHHHTDTETSKTKTVLT